MVRRLAALVLGLWLAAALPAAAGPFEDWAAVVVAGDFRAHNGKPSETFDNARRDVSAALTRVGFKADNLRQFSVRPERYKDTNPAKSEAQGVYTTLKDLTTKTAGGCLAYFTSHGTPQGMVMDERMLAPGVLAQILDRTCGERPTVVVISACFSGVFVPALAASNRMVLTAARPDRSSFGCGESDKYPYFDECFLQSIEGAADFPALAATVQTCVRDRERKEGMKPASEPQVWVGAALKPLLPLYAFAPSAVRRN
ncbi:C13 family peptidase [Phenylobacterium sp.]|jgi:hypothetical protein|uniref:C13 family peptidase n=1 Tax=Phenylobacterium sp. TaxID=1871053 RepID=UPI002F933A95